MSAISGHAGHVGTLLGPALLLAFWAGWSDLRAWMHRQGDQLAPASVLVAAALSAGAGVIHAIVMPHHFTEDLLYGGFFAAAAAAQLAWSVLVVVRTSGRMLRAGVVGNAAVLILWLETRTVAVPLGALAGRREAVGTMDVACGLLEVGVMACCTWAMARSADRPTADAHGLGRNATGSTSAAFPG